ncbi:MAG: hypothetical protein K6F25_08440 [Bacteroidales bacterium]|nr:hypothetical protein [Bacteroidales bacterium]
MKLNKIFKWVMIALILVSVGLLVWGFAQKFTDGNVEALLYWTYAMVALAIFCVVVLGLIVSAINNPKSLVRVGILLAGACALVLVAYLLAQGAPALGREGLDPASTLKLTDTVLNLTYIVGAAAIVAIIVGEIRMAIVNKK